MNLKFDSKISFGYPYGQKREIFDPKKFENPFIGGFGCKNPNHLIDKEVYFYCIHNAETPNGQPVSFSSVSLVVNDTYKFDFNANQWSFNDYLYLGIENGLKFQNGDKVCLYVNGDSVSVAQWKCDISQSRIQNILTFAQEQWNALPDKKKISLCGSVGKKVFQLTAILCKKIR